MKSLYTIPIAIVLGGALVAVAIYFTTPKRAPEVSNPTLVRGVGPTDHIFGNPAAKAIIVEYADFDCEYCKDFNDTMHQVIANEGATGEVAWVFREFPLSEIHPNALAHARAAECAAQVAGNDAFWRFEDALYAAQPAVPSDYGTVAKNAGITGSTFASCYATVSATLEERIQADRKNALDMGARGTPYSLILVAGKAPVVLNGAYGYDAVKQFLDQALTP